MTSKNEIENAESFSQPIIEEIIEVFSKADYELLVKNFPELTKSISQGLYNEGVEDLKNKGNVVSLQFIGTFNKVNEQVLLWKVRYEQKEEDVLWHLFLSDFDGEIKVAALCII